MWGARGALHFLAAEKKASISYVWLHRKASRGAGAVQGLILGVLEGYLAEFSRLEKFYSGISGFWELSRGTCGL